MTDHEAIRAQTESLLGILGQHAVRDALPRELLIEGLDAALETVIELLDDLAPVPGDVADPFDADDLFDDDDEPTRAGADEFLKGDR